MEEDAPEQASLRRAVSTAYYAAFHLLLQDASWRMSSQSSLLASQIARAFSHGEMRQVCRAIQKGTGSFALEPVQSSDALRSVAYDFLFLQEERHRADYDPGALYSSAEAGECVGRVEALFQTWSRIRDSEEANVFCAALLLGTRWAK